MKYHALFFLFLKKQQNLKFSSAAKCRSRFKGKNGVMLQLFLTIMVWYLYLCCPMYRNTAIHLYLVVIFIWRCWSYKQKMPNYEKVKYIFEFSYTIGNKWTHILSILVLV